jgi:hypothetical protein
VREPAGKAALLRLYLEEFDKSETTFKVSDYLLRLRQGPYREGALALWENRITVETLAVPSGHHTFSQASAPTNSRRRQRILELLEACAGDTFRAPGFDGFEFQIAQLAAGEAPAPAFRESLTGEPMATWLSRYPDLRYLCFFRVLGSSK